MIVDIKKTSPKNNHLDLSNGGLGNNNTKISSPKPKLSKESSRWFLDFFSILILIILSVIILIPSLTKPDEIAPGADVGTHVYIAKYLTDFIKENGEMPAVNPYWYAGWESYHNNPRVMSVLLGIGYFLNGNIIKVSQVGQALIIIFAALVMYWVIRRRYSSLSALLGSVLFTFSPAFLFDIVYLGSFPRSLAMALAPLCFYFLERVLRREKTIRSMVFSALILGISILTHPLSGATLLIFFSIYVVLRIFGDRKYPYIKLVSLIIWSLISLFALGTVTFYIAPFFLEKSGWYKLPETLPLITSIPPLDLISRIGLPLIVSVIIFLAKKNKVAGSWPLFITGVIAALFSIGAYGPVYRFFSFTNVYPFLGVMFAAFAFSYVIASNLKIKWEFKSKTRNLILVQVLAILIIYSAFDGFMDTRATKFNQDQFFQPQTVEISERLKKYENPGRLIPMKYPFGFLIWWLTVESKIPVYEGWYYSTTLQGKHIAWIYDAINHGFPEYALKRFEQLKIRYILITRNFYRDRRDQNLNFLKKAVESGFQKVEDIKSPYYEESSYVLFFQDKPVSFLSPVKEKILVIGKHAMPVNTILEDAIQGQSIFIDEYDIELLKNFDTIILIGFSFHNKEKAESLIRELARFNKKIIIDMYDSNGSLLEENLTFLGVSSYKEIYKDTVFTKRNNESNNKDFFIPSQFEVPEELNENFDDLAPESEENPRRIKLKEWRFVSYTNLDKIYARIQKEQDNFFGIIGYKELEGNKIWFIGPNIFYHTYLTKNHDELSLIKKLTASSKEEFEIEIGEEILDPDKGYLKFSFASVKPFLGLVSFTYSQHWKAYLDGNEIKVYNLEDLMALDLPAGNHTLELYYKNILIHSIGRTVSVIFFSVLIILLIISFFIKDKKENENLDY